MFYRILADVVAGIHILFIIFVLFGGVLVMRWPRLAWVQIPAALWGVAIEMGGWICPLTYLENNFRHKGLLAGYGKSFIDHYILPLIYPALLFSGAFPSWGYTAIGIIVLATNFSVYWLVWRRYRSS